MTTAASTHSDLLNRWPTLSTAERLKQFHALPHEEADDFFLDIPAHDQAELIRSMAAGERRLWVRLLAPDDAADLLQEFEPGQRDHFMADLDDSMRSEVGGLLAYREDMAGGRMSPRFSRLRPESTVDEAIAYLRRQAKQVETIYYAYAVDDEQHLLGVVSLGDLFVAERTKRVKDVMRTSFVSVTENADQEEAARLFRQHHLLAIPVVDATQHIKGIITVDDIVSVLQEEASEDIQKMGGSEVLEGPYLEISFFEMIRKRAGWLAILFVGEMLTATAMGYFADEIARAVVLALFIPLIISSGGNSGSQATSLIIRALAVRDITLGDWWRVIRRELAAGLALGCVLAAIALVRILLWPRRAQIYGPHYVLVAATVACSLIGVVLFGSIAGSMLPFILRRLGF